MLPKSCLPSDNLKIGLCIKLCIFCSYCIGFFTCLIKTITLLLLWTVWLSRSALGVAAFSDYIDKVTLTYFKDPHFRKMTYAHTCMCVCLYTLTLAHIKKKFLSSGKFSAVSYTSWYTKNFCQTEWYLCSMFCHKLQQSQNLQVNIQGSLYSNLKLCSTLKASL